MREIYKIEDSNSAGYGSTIYEVDPRKLKKLKRKRYVVEIGIYTYFMMFKSLTVVCSTLYKNTNILMVGDKRKNNIFDKSIKIRVIKKSEDFISSFVTFEKMNGYKVNYKLYCMTDNIKEFSKIKIKQ